MTRQFYPTTSDLPLLLDGRQNALVRPMVPQPGEDAHIMKIADRPGQYIDLRDSEFFDGKKEILTRWNCPFGSANDILWCKEPRLSIEWGHPYGGDSTPTMKPAISMPKAACRLWLQVLEVKVCKIEDLTEWNALQMGFRDLDDAKLRYLWRIGDPSNWIWYATVARIEKP
jgi:hypothetical protein